MELFPSRPPVDFSALFPLKTEAEAISGDWEAISGDLHSSLKKATTESSFDVERTGAKTA